MNGSREPSGQPDGTFAAPQPMEVVGEFVVEHPGADLEWEMRPPGCPAHLLLLHHPLAHHLVDRRLRKGAGDGLAGAVALPVVGDAPGVGPDVAAELGHRSLEFALFWAWVLDVEVHLQILRRLQGTEDVAVPEEPLEAA